MYGPKVAEKPHLLPTESLRPGALHLKTSMLKSVLLSVLILWIGTGCDAFNTSRQPTEEETQLLNQIAQLHSQGQFQKGVDLARAHLAEHPDAPLFHYAIGTLLGSMDDHDAAIAEIQIELERRPNHFDSHYAIATALSLKGDLEAAISYLEKARRLRPEHPGSAFLLGRNLSELGRLDEAEPHLKEATELQASAKAFSELGKLFQRQGHDEAAEGAFRRAMDLDPLYPAAMYNLGQTLLRLGREEEGRELLALHEEKAADFDRFDSARQSSRLEGSQAGNFLILAREHLSRGQLDEAAEAYSRAGQLEPQLPAPALGLAGIYLQQKKIDEATKAAVLAVALDPTRSRSHFVLGIARLHRGEPQGAASDFRMSKSLGDWTPDMYIHLGETHRELGQFDESAEAYRRASELDPESALAETGLGLLLYQKGEVPAAIEALDGALEVDPEQAAAWMTLAIARFSQGQSEAAEEAFRKALRNQRLALLGAKGREELVRRFASLPNSEPALARYRELREELFPSDEQEDPAFVLKWGEGQ